MKKAIMILLLTAICISSFAGAFRECAEAAFYEELEVKVEVRGTGNFAMEEVGNQQNKQTVTSTGQAFFVMKYDEPGSYRYYIYNEDGASNKKYVADINIYQSEKSSNQLTAVVTITNAADNKKLDNPIADYTPVPSPDQVQPGQSQVTATQQYGKEETVKTGDTNEMIFYVLSFAAGLALAGHLIIARGRKSD